MAFLDIFGKKKKGRKAAQEPKKRAKKPVKAEKKPEIKEENINELEIDKEVWPIKYVAIVEILGAPKEHVIETMNVYLEKMKKEKGIKIVKTHVSEVEQKETLFSVFAEIEMLAKSPSRIVDYCFEYMPSSIEIIEPEHIAFNAHDFSNFFNDLQARLHNLDMVVKKLRAENKILNDNAHLILRNNILLSLKEKDKDLAAISKNIGIAEEKTKVFLEALIKQKFIILKKNKYSLNKEKVTFSE